MSGTYMDLATHASAAGIVLTLLVLSRTDHAVECVSRLIKSSRSLQVLLSVPSLLVFAGSVGLLPGVPDAWVEPSLSSRVVVIGFGLDHVLVLCWLAAGWARRAARRSIAEAALRTNCKSSTCSTRVETHV